MIKQVSCRLPILFLCCSVLTPPQTEFRLSLHFSLRSCWQRVFRRNYYRLTMIFWWIALFAFFNHLLIYTRLFIKISLNRLNRPSHRVSMKRLLIPDVFWLLSIPGPGFDLMILVHNESFTSPQHRQLIFVSLQLLYLFALVASRVRHLLFSSDYYLQIFQVVPLVRDWDRAEWHSRFHPSNRRQWRAILSVVMPAVVCLISLLSCVWSVGNPLAYSLLSRPLTNFSFVIILLKFPHSKAENAPWPYVARHNRALRLIFLTPVWASWLSRFPWLLPTQDSRLLLVADILVFVSSSVVAGISSYYATSKDGPEQLICFTVGDKPFSSAS